MLMATVSPCLLNRLYRLSAACRSLSETTQPPEESGFRKMRPAGVAADMTVTAFGGRQSKRCPAQSRVKP
jgi:hypothetical protein